MRSVLRSCDKLARIGSNTRCFVS